MLGFAHLRSAGSVPLAWALPGWAPVVRALLARALLARALLVWGPKFD